MPIYEQNKLRTSEVSAKRKPIIVNDVNDPRLKAYNDSLSLYNSGNKIKQSYLNVVNNAGLDENKLITSPISISGSKISPVNEMYLNSQGGGAKRMSDGSYQNYSSYLGKNGVDKVYLDDSKLNKYLKKSVKLYKKPEQQIVYQKPIQQPVQQIVQPTVQTIQQAPQSKENWEAKPNTIIFNMNGKEMFSTSDKVNELFKTEIDKMTAAGVSQETIDSILKQKYKIRNRETTYLPDDATQKAITVKATNLYK